MGKKSLTELKIALLQGGMGSERDVSRVTGASFAKALDELGCTYTVVEADESLPQTLLDLQPDVALLAVHGKYAEDGTVQGICEFLKIPYTGSGLLSSALCMDKNLSKKIFQCEGIPTPAYQLIRDKAKSLEIELPVVVKPSRDGSSVAVTIVRSKDQFDKAVAEALQYDRDVLVEECIEGREVTVSVLDGKGLPSIEIVPKTDFYNYENKYTAGNTDYIIPARLPDEVLKHCNALSVKAAEVLGTRTYCRVDLMVANDKDPYVLEVNTLPGCTPTSLLPKAAGHVDIQFTEIVKTLIEQARTDYEGLA